MTETFLNNMGLIAYAMFFLGFVGILVAVAFVWDGMQERKFREEGFDYEWEGEAEALARIYNHPSVYDQEGVR